MTKPKWSVHEWQSCYTVRDEHGRMVCRCSLTAYGKKYAELIAKLPELLKQAEKKTNDGRTMSNEKFSTAEWGVKHIDTFCGEQGLGVIGSVVCLTIGDLVYPLGATGIQWGNAEQKKAYDTAVANAYLMREAPNMYYLLDKCEGCIRKLLDGPVDDPVWGEAENTINEIRALLEKARGENE